MLPAYESKLMSADQAAALIKPEGSLVLGMATSEPPEILKALQKRLDKKEIKELRLYYMHSMTHAEESILQYCYMDIIKPHPFYVGSIEHALQKKGEKEGRKIIDYMPGNFSDVPRILEKIEIDTMILTVSPMDKDGYFFCGTNADYTIPAAKLAKTTIVEVNQNMPRAFGDCSLHISEIDAIVEFNAPLIEIPYRPLNSLDKKIGAYIAEMIPDHATLQIGIGHVPNAICKLLENHKGLGIHTELMTTGLAELIKQGVVTNEYKTINRYKSVYTLALGNKGLYEFLDYNPATEAYPVTYINNPSIISQNKAMMSVNSFIEVDLTGQVNSEFIHNHQFSAPGGQLDFVRGARMSPGGKSIITAYSTAQDGKVSRIVPKISGPVTVPRTEVQYIATEYGVADLEGKSTTERAIALIQIAHPQFRDALYEKAKEMHFF